jgi:hypothetical protein
MKAKGVDDWLKHWLKLQTKGKHPLTFKDQSESAPNCAVRTGKRSKRKGKQRVEVDESGDEDHRPESGNGSDTSEGSEGGTSNDPAGSAKPITPIGQKSKGKGKPAAKASNFDNKTKTDSSENKKKLGDASATTGSGTDTPALPSAPVSAGRSKDTRRRFLEALSDDKNYRLLIRLLLAARVRI